MVASIHPDERLIRHHMRLVNDANTNFQKYGPFYALPAKAKIDYAVAQNKLKREL